MRARFWLVCVASSLIICPALAQDGLGESKKEAAAPEVERPELKGAKTDASKKGPGLEHDSARIEMAEGEKLGHLTDAIHLLEIRVDIQWCKTPGGSLFSIPRSENCPL